MNEKDQSTKQLIEELVYLEGTKLIDAFITNNRSKFRDVDNLIEQAEFVLINSPYNLTRDILTKTNTKSEKKY